MTSSGLPPSTTARLGPASSRARGLSVLLVDDEEAVSDLLRTWLTGLGHAVTCATGGVEAEKLLGVRRFDVVVTDIVMPDGDGFELMAALRRLQPTTRVLAISGGGTYLRQPDCLKIAKGLGAALVVEKPFTRAQFLAAFAQITA